MDARSTEGAWIGTVVVLYVALALAGVAILDRGPRTAPRWTGTQESPAPRG